MDPLLVLTLEMNHGDEWHKAGIKNGGESIEDPPRLDNTMRLNLLKLVGSFRK